MIKRLKTERLILILIIIISLFGHLVYGIEGAKQTQTYEYKIERQVAQLKDKDYQIKILEIILENRELDASEPMSTEPEYLGTFTVTHYCPCEICCGKTDGITSTGTQATEGRTVAVDPDVIPLGSTVVIDGQEYIAEDIGGAIKGNRIDKYMDSHQEALNAGVVQVDVWIGG